MSERSGDAIEPRLGDRLGSIDERYEGNDLVFVRRGRGNISNGVELLRFDTTTQLLRIFPRAWRANEYGPQFRQIVELQIEDFDLDPDSHSGYSNQFGLAMLNGLPKGFGSVYEYGLGIRPEYRGLLHSIEEHADCTVVRFVGAGGDEGQKGATYTITLSRFEEYRQMVDRNKRRGQTAVGRVIDAERHNAVADLFGLETVEPKYAKNSIINALTEEVARGHVMTATDRAELVDEVRVQAYRVARESPERWGQLREDVELASLELLIERFEQGLVGPAASDESHWQRFFRDNPFALQQVFGVPVVQKRELAHVRGGDVGGQGARIADFLCMNTVTRTALVVEIKTPAAPLMEPQAYRGRGESAVHAPHHGHLAGAVAQVQSQVAAVPQDLAHRLYRTPDLRDLDPWHTSGAVIAGRVGHLTPEQHESFLRYREGLAGVTVLGFDEVCERLKGLLELLRGTPHSTGVRRVARSSHPSSGH